MEKDRKKNHSTNQPLRIKAAMNTSEIYKRNEVRRQSHQPSPIVEGEKTIGKIIWLAIFLIAGAVLAVLIVNGPKKSVDFVKNQLSFALTPGEKSGFIAAKDFHGSTEKMETMSYEQLIVLLETDRYGSDDDDIAISALQVIYRQLAVFGNHPEKALHKRLLKVTEDIIDVDKEWANFALEYFIRHGESFSNCPSSFPQGKITMAAVVRYFLLKLN